VIDKPVMTSGRVLGEVLEDPIGGDASPTDTEWAPTSQGEICRELRPIEADIPPALRPRTEQELTLKKSATIQPVAERIRQLQEQL
jgi:hypothetical protein